MVILHTSQGDITLELDAENAPATVTNFLQYVRDGHFDNTIFHRVIDGFMVQGGGMEPGMKQKSVRAPVANEAGNGLKNKRYTVAMARTSEPALGDRAVLHQCRRQRFSRPQGAEPAGLGILRLRARHRGHGRRRQDQGRGDRHARRPPERTERGRGDRARRGSPIKPTLFLSDLHLSPARPALVEAFDSFCAGPARDAAGVYVLGDLFDTWIGDDQLRDPMAERVALGLRSIANSGVAVGMINGNRDFLVGERFADVAGATLLPEQIVINLAGTPTLLLHGDELCTGDAGYQKYRAFMRNSKYQRRFLALSLLPASRHRHPPAPQEPSRDRRETRVDPRCRSRRRRVGVSLGERHAHDPRTHAPTRAPSSRRRRTRERALGAGRLVRPRHVYGIRRRRRPHARRVGRSIGRATPAPARNRR